MPKPSKSMKTVRNMTTSEPRRRESIGEQQSAKRWRGMIRSFFIQNANRPAKMGVTSAGPIWYVSEHIDNNLTDPLTFYGTRGRFSPCASRGVWRVGKFRQNRATARQPRPAHFAFALRRITTR